MLRLILGTAGSGKTALITNEIRQRAQSGETGLYLIVPEQFSHEAERELCALCGDSFSLHSEVLSFTRLAVRVAQETGTGGKTALDAGGRLLCMTLALGQIGSQLCVYKGAERKSELQGSLLAAVEQLRAARIGATELQAAMEGAGSALADKLHDLSLCLEAYEAVLSQGRADPTDRLLHLARSICKSSIGSGGQIYIDGFTDFTGAELEVIAALLGKGAELTVCLTCDGLDSDSEHFAPARAAAHELLRLAKEKNAETQIVVSEGRADKALELCALGEGLYRYTAEKTENSGGRVRLVRCDCMRDECEMAAARCLELVDKGCRWRDIAVAVRGFGGYASALEDAFALYGVPLFSARRESILQKSVPALISASFETIAGGWDTDAVLAYLKSGLAPISQEDCDELENYARLWSIRGGMWTQKKPWSQHPDGISAPFDEDSKARLAHLDELRRAVLSPLKRLEEDGKKAQTADKHCRALADFFAAISLPETLYHRSEELERSGFGQLASEYDKLWNIAVTSLEQFAAVLGGTPMTQSEFQKLYLRLISQYDVSVIPVSADSVSAGDMDRMRRRRIKHLIILGASEDKLPAVTSAGGLFSDSEREELSSLGVRLGGSADDISRELSLIYNCVTLPSESITVSWSAADAAGAECSPSFLVRRARLIFDMEDERFSRNAARLMAKEPAYLLAAQYAGGKGGSRLAYDYFAECGETETLLSLAERSQRGRGALSPKTAATLYGERLSISPSRADSFSACRFQYFLRYGLRLTERERASFDAPELGTFMHYVLENVAGELSRSVGFKAADDELTQSLCDKYIEKYTAERLGGLSDKSARFIYLYERLKPSVRRVVKDMVRELSRSDFEPLDFELSFMSDGDLPPVTLSDGERELRINGIADRVDGCFKDGKLYLRVVDYKTGKKSFSFTDVWYGMGLQMLLYLFALEQEGEQRYGCKVEPAGVMYVPARDIVVSAPGDLSDEELAAAKQKKLRRSGLILKDADIIEAMEHGSDTQYLPVKFSKSGEPSKDCLADVQQLEALRAHVTKRMLELGDALQSGCIEAEPFYKGETENACSFCPYFAVCRFDEEQDKRRYFSKLKPEEFWARLEESV